MEHRIDLSDYTIALDGSRWDASSRSSRRNPWIRTLWPERLDEQKLAGRGTQVLLRERVAIDPMSLSGLDMDVAGLPVRGGEPQTHVGQGNHYTRTVVVERNPRISVQFRPQDADLGVLHLNREACG